MVWLCQERISVTGQKMHGLQDGGVGCKKIWNEALEKDCWTKQLNKEDAMHCSHWRNLIEDIV